MKNIDIFIRIAKSLLTDYLSIYCVNPGTGAYCRFSTDNDTETEGTDFFADISQKTAPTIYEEDRRVFADFLREDNLRGIAKDTGAQSPEFRVIVEGKPVWHTVKTVFSADMLVLGIVNIDTQVRERQKAEQLIKEREVFNQIADSLASNYDVIYYIDRDSSSYSAYTARSIYGQLEVQESGVNFFSDALKNAEVLVHPNDKERVMNALERDTLITQLYIRKKFSINYRLVIDGRVQYTRFTVMWSGDKKHIVIGVENIDSEIKKEKDHLKALNSEKELARRDDLTGTKNKTAYLELTRTVQENIDNGINYLTFAIVVCDINGLKQINDNEGHQAGDEYIKECAKLVCTIFAHSPVFRIGGDEFVVFIRGGDYAFKGDLFEKLRKQVLVNKETPGKPVIASGMSSFDPSADKSVGEVFERADNMMYENKKWLKGGEEPR